MGAGEVIGEVREAICGPALGLVVAAGVEEGERGGCSGGEGLREDISGGGLLGVGFQVP